MHALNANCGSNKDGEDAYFSKVLRRRTLSHFKSKGVKMGNYIVIAHSQNVCWHLILRCVSTNKSKYKSLITTLRLHAVFRGFTLRHSFYSRRKSFTFSYKVTHFISLGLNIQFKRNTRKIRYNVVGIHMLDASNAGVLVKYAVEVYQLLQICLEI